MIPDVKKEQAKGIPIVAVKGAHDLLVENGILPDYYINVDPRDRTNTVQRKNQHTQYLIASRCPPALFDYLADCNVKLFHTFNYENNFPELHGKPQVTGGSTSGLRMVMMGYGWGYRRFIFFGMDSCVEDRRKRFYGDPMPPEKLMDVRCGDETFTCNGAMALQAQDFRDMLRHMPDCEFDIRGGGLLAKINEEFNARRLSASRRSNDGKLPLPGDDPGEGVV